MNIVRENVRENSMGIGAGYPDLVDRSRPVPVCARGYGRGGGGRGVAGHDGDK